MDEGQPPEPATKGPAAARLAIGGLAVVLAAAGGYYWGHRENATPPPQAQTTPLAQPDLTPSPRASHYPVPTLPSVQPSSPAEAKLATPPTTLDSSDDSINQGLAGLFGKDTFALLFNSKDWIRRFVVTVVNASEHRLPRRLSPFNPVKDTFRAATSSDGTATLDAANYSRYLPYVQAFAAVDTAKSVALYVRMYPLFQAAFGDLGVPGYFNDRLVGAIDHCLATPDPKPPITLTPANLSFKFSDPALEALSDAQKILIRMGPDNEAIVKDKLRMIRSALAHLGPDS